MFKKAVKSKSWLKLALVGPSFSGKTYSALRVATGIASLTNGRVAVIDTEAGSAGLYSDKFDFDVDDISAPFTVDKYIQAIDAAIKGKYPVVVIDSMSHEWSGEGGIVEMKSSIDARGGNSFANWQEPKKLHAKLKNKIVTAPIHIISCFRAKQAYNLSSDEGKKTKIQKLGLEPIGEPSLEYDYTICFDIASDHLASVSKDRTGHVPETIQQLTEDVGKSLIEWLNKDAVEVKLSRKEELLKLADEYGWGIDQVAKMLVDHYGVKLADDLKEGQFQELKTIMETCDFVSVGEKYGNKT